MEPLDHWVHPEEDCFRHTDMFRGDEMVNPPKRKLTANDSATIRGLAGAENIKAAAEVIFEPAKDNVVLPEHYARFKIEPVRFSIENNLNGFQFNIIKYILRHDAKNGLEDLRKAKRYIEMFIKYVEGDPNWWCK